MTIKLPKLRLSWIALAAFVGALLGSGESSMAFCSSMSSGQGCVTVRSCCEVALTDLPAKAVVGSSKAHEQVSARVAEIRQGAPRGGCTCRSEAPTAPEPKGDRSEQSRPDPRRIEEIERLDFRVIPQPFLALVLSTGSHPPKSPTYLLHCRFLI